MQNRIVHRYSGFSLIELSIVLVIVALVVGGLLGTQAMIKAQELRKVGVDTLKFGTATREFRTHYNGWPGDLINATQIWGAQTGATTPGVVAACAALTTAPTTVATCNGNGDGRIGWTNSHEVFRFWQQLNNAGLIEVKMRGSAVPNGGIYTTGSSIPGNNVPESVIKSVGFEARWTTLSAIDYTNSVGNGLVVAKPFIFEDTSLALGSPSIPTTDVKSLDLKLDDGMPFTGKFLAPRYNTAGTYCTDPASFLSSASASHDYYWRQVGLNPVSDCYFIYNLL